MFGRAVAHQAVAVAAQVADADVVAPDDQDVGLLGHRASCVHGTTTQNVGRTRSASHHLIWARPSIQSIVRLGDLGAGVLLDEVAAAQRAWGWPCAPGTCSLERPVGLAEDRVAVAEQRQERLVPRPSAAHAIRLAGTAGSSCRVGTSFGIARAPALEARVGNGASYAARSAALSFRFVPVATIRPTGNTGCAGERAPDLERGRRCAPPWAGSRWPRRSGRTGRRSPRRVAARSASPSPGRPA